MRAYADRLLRLRRIEFSVHTGFIFGREVARRMLPRGYATIIYSGASAALRGRAAFAAFAAAKAGLSQSFAREFGPRGIHVADVIIDGSINGDKIFSKVPENQNMSHPVRT
jgi:NAD(P)-dependent dehydrogenase (short-subunit alcohol dehydrogenase family)